MKGKFCSKCGEEKSLEEYSLVFPSKNDGKFRPDCKVCVGLRATIRYKNWSTDERKVKSQRNKNRVAVLVAKEHVRDYLTFHPCVDCGESNLDVLDFDHVRDIKNNEISRMTARGYLISSIDIEISKCEVRCSNCHRKRHAKERRERNEGKV